MNVLLHLLLVFFGIALFSIGSVETVLVWSSEPLLRWYGVAACGLSIWFACRMTRYCEEV